MTLFNRLVGIEKPKIPAHQFTDALGEWEDGETGARAKIVAHWELDAAEEVTLDQLKTIFLASTNKTEFAQVLERCLRLGEIGYPGYTTQGELVTRLNKIT